jgi:hypothetical protein
MPTQLLYLLRVRGLDPLIRHRLEKTLEQAYDDDLGYGFSQVNHFDEDTYTGNLIFSAVSNRKAFDFSSNRLVDRSQVVYQEVEFELNLSNGIVALHGGGNRLRKFVNTIGIASANKVSIDQISLDIGQAIEYIRKNSASFELTGLLVRNYKPSADLSGRFAAKVFSFTAAKELLATYETDVLEFTGVFELDEEDIRIRMSRAGALALNSTEDGIRKGLDLVKSLFLESSHA